jgi:hypothetical protein
MKKFKRLFKETASKILEPLPDVALKECLVFNLPYLGKRAQQSISCF